MGYSSDAVADSVRRQIAAEAMNQQARADRRRLVGDEADVDVDRTAIPPDKPRPDAQWDEAAGRWEIWSSDAGGWVSLEDGTVQAPASRSVRPTEPAILWPPLIDPA